jgi:predicted helicase
MTDKTTEVFLTYLKNLSKALSTGDATEHTHRPALKDLIEGLTTGITATNEPKHIKCGAPDFIVRKGATTIGYIEAKDIGKNLDEAEKSEQLERYLPLSNVILTDYLEFRWYIDGKIRLKAILGTQTKDNKVKQDSDGTTAVIDLLNGFLVHQAKGVGTPKELATRMANLAHIIRNLITNVFINEAETGSLHSQLTAFRDSLIPDLTVAQFADMYAQTIAYGLFAARCSPTAGANFTRYDAAQSLPKTNPFLRKTFQYIAGYDMDERITWAVDDLAQILAQADMTAVLESFSKHSGKEDPVVHFYETFLQAYDPKVREMRGVYYTPEPVVSYIVRSIDHLLKTRFNRPQGLADKDTMILDPATGTATFLYMVINEIHKSFAGQEGMWDNYVAEVLLKRIFGFELLMAPYAIAHLKLGLQLQETGYKFQSEERLGIYLTNTLEEAVKVTELLPGFNKYIVDEANAAAEIKKEKPIMVVLGNPPYSGHSVNKGEWARQLVELYKTVDGNPLGEKNPKWLQDDYVKFFAFGQWRIDRTGQGVLGFITNHSYLDNPTFRGMRQSLMNTFTDIYILNLHGNSKKKEVAIDGSKDENVFDIQQGVAICLLVKEEGKTKKGQVHYADLWGLREGKYKNLLETDINDTDWQKLKPHMPHYLFIQQDETQLKEYEMGWKLTDIFPVNSVGIVTARDEVVLDFYEHKLRSRVEEFRGNNLNDDEIRDKYKLKDTKVWNVINARKALRKDENYEQAFTCCLYRPFDIRSLFYHKDMVERSRLEVMLHLQHINLSLVCPKRVETVGTWQHILCSRNIVDHVAVSLKTIDSTFPLYLYPTEGEMQFDGGKRRPNLNPEFIKEFSAKLGLKFIDDGKGDLKKTFGPEDIFYYAYAVFHSPTYRTRYAEFLKIDFPRLPLTADKALFKKLAEKGGELVALHLMESAALNNMITKYPIKGDNKVEKVSYIEKEQRVYINTTQYFEGVPVEVWNFHIGGYQVCEKWLKDRKGRVLAYDELTHYQRVVVALKETIRIMAEIDKIIPSWPIT